MNKFQNANVKATFDAYPQILRNKLLKLRQLIFDTAAEIPNLGDIEETLKWGQPSYLTPISKSGTTIRIDQIKSSVDTYGLFVNCQTSLMATYRELYPEQMNYEGKRLVRFHVDQDPPENILKNCIAIAFTYHLDKNRDQLPF